MADDDKPDLLADHRKSAEDAFRFVLDGLPTFIRIDYAMCEQDEEDLERSRPPLRASVGFVFSQKGFGFGEIYILQTQDGVFIDSELMGREGVKHFLGALIDAAILDTDTDPDKHEAYRKATKSSCGPGCLARFPHKEET